MYKIVILCALFVCSQSAPTTDKPIESDSTATLVHEKSISYDHSAVADDSIPAEKREKREDFPATLQSSSSVDNKRTPALSQSSDYQENKPPTFVHPVPVDQIIKHSNASPEIHSSSKHIEEEEVKEEPIIETNDKVTNEDEDTAPQHKHHNRAYHKHTLKTEAPSEEDDEISHENINSNLWNFLFV